MSTELANVSTQLGAPTRQSSISIKELLERRELIVQAMGVAMKDGLHFGKIPGCGDKPTLMQPGAQLLCQLFQLRPEYDVTTDHLENGHVRFSVTCRLFTIGSDMKIGEGVGEGSSMESKHRFRGGSRKCPECGKEAIIKGKAEYGGGWICFAKKGGCGHKWADGAQEIEGQSVDKQENENPADTFNTVLKMAKKRAFVDATITATASSDFFTQDLEDIRGNMDQAKARAEAQMDADEIPGTGPHTTKEAAEPVTEENWRDILNTAADPKGRYYVKIGELPSTYLDWFLHNEKGTAAYWVSKPQFAQPRILEAMKFAWNAKLLEKEQAATNQERPEEAGEHSQDPKPEEKKKTAPKGSVAMLLKMVNKSGFKLTDFTAAAQELSILPDDFEDLTDTQAAELMEKFQALVEHLKPEQA